MNERTPNDRRNALEGKRFQVLFYGGWYMVDEKTRQTTEAESINEALTMAEDHNRDNEHDALEDSEIISAQNVIDFLNKRVRFHKSGVENGTDREKSYHLNAERELHYLLGRFFAHNMGIRKFG